MRRRRRGGFFGRFLVMAGIGILLALIMPPGFWWLALAILLIGCGIWFLRCF